MTKRNLLTEDFYRTAIIEFNSLISDTLKRENDFTVCFNSKNYPSLRLGDYSLIVIAGFPESDKNDDSKMREVLSNLSRINSKARIVYISTTKIYSQKIKHDESDMPQINKEFLFEVGLSKIFNSKLFIIRVPLLFGEGIKIDIFEKIKLGQLDGIDFSQALQFIDRKFLCSYINFFISGNISRNIINLVGEPVEILKILEALNPDKALLFSNKDSYYDKKISNFVNVQTNFLGLNNRYFFDKESTINLIKKYYHTS